MTPFNAMMRTIAVLLAGLWMSATAHDAVAGDVLRIGSQTTGTFAWQLNVIRRHGLAERAGLDLKITDYASPDAGKLALNAGTVDLAVIDWLWVARSRALGARLLFYPYSSAAGAVMVKPDSLLRSLGDLKGNVLSVAGGPLDKSWLIVQAAALRQNVDLKRDVTLQYGAPPLIFETSRQSDAGASLNFWNFCARLDALGYRRLLDVRDAQILLGLKQPVALIGYVFNEDFTAKQKTVIDRFIAITRQANDILMSSDEEWATLRPLMQAEDDATFIQYRDRTREGMLRRPIAEETADAGALFATLADLGGEALVGPSKQLDLKLYYQPAPHGD